MDPEQSFAHFVLHAGMVMGALSRPEIEAELVRSIQDGDLHPSYVAMLRDKLTRVLVASGADYPSTKGPTP